MATTWESRRERRLNAPRAISDPEHGPLGTIQKTADGWKALPAADSFQADRARTFRTKKQAINSLCDANNVPRWFPQAAD